MKKTKSSKIKIKPVLKKGKKAILKIDTSPQQSIFFKSKEGRMRE